MYVIPVDNSPNNTFRCTVPVDGKAIKFKFKFSFNSEAGYWYMDISKSDNTPLLSSIPLKTISLYSLQSSSTLLYLA